MTSVAPREIVSAHSPDSDDAFMFYGLATKKVRSSKVTFRHVLADIETLNRKAQDGEYELSAISYHAYPYVADKYVLMASGSSVGDGYGPMIIANRPMEPEEIWSVTLSKARCRPKVLERPSVAMTGADDMLRGEFGSKPALWPAQSDAAEQRWQADWPGRGAGLR